MKDLIGRRFNKLRIMGFLLQGIPFVRAALLNGSLAQGKSKVSSDIDLLIITKSKRLWTARFFSMALVSVIGWKRSKDKNRSHAGKFCFNYFIVDNYLKIPDGRGKKIDKYCADNYSKSVLVSGDDLIFKKFLAVNKILFGRSQNQKKVTNHHHAKFPLSDVKIATALRRSCERILSGPFGNWLESKLRNWQTAKIERDPRTTMYPSLIAYSEKEARFHPPKS